MVQITKTTGKKQKYAPTKLLRSLRRAGASRAVAETIVAQIPLQESMSTQDIHNYAFRMLREHYPPVAARYNIKAALLRLGPTGYPFEKFVAEIFRARGYRVATNQILHGRCIAHEVDVVAENDERKVFMECKYHTQKRARSNVKVALYIKARFDDLLDVLRRDASGKKIQGVIITNTEFSHDAQRYARCVAGLGLIEWRRPRGFSLAELIDQTGLHPVSALTSLSRTQKDTLMRNGVVLCRDVAKKISVLERMGLSEHKRDRVVREARAVCALQMTL